MLLTCIDNCPYRIINRDYEPNDRQEDFTAFCTIPVRNIGDNIWGQPADRQRIRLSFTEDGETTTLRCQQCIERFGPGMAKRPPVKFSDIIHTMLDLVFGDLAEIVKEATGETIHVTIRKAGTS